MMTDELLGKALRAIWEDQAAFNLLFRDPPQTPGDLAKQVRDFTLLTESELHELLRCTQWKSHRRYHVAHNDGHMQDEAADIFKCVVSIFQILGMRPEDLVNAYWQKTMVVRQRYREEWTDRLDGPCAVIDIDNVLADYINGFGSWLLNTQSMIVADQDRLRVLMKQGAYLTAAAMQVEDDTWQRWKHAFRTSGGKRTLPVMPGAKDFLQRLQTLGYRIVLLTSRPIDRYPNIYTDTLLWLQAHELPFDFIWWSHDKAERVLEGDIRSKIHLFVDDDSRFIQQMARLGIRSYWLTNSAAPQGVAELLATLPMVRQVATLHDVLIHITNTEAINA